MTENSICNNAHVQIQGWKTPLQKPRGERVRYSIMMAYDYFQIVFEGIRGNGYRGDIALDDIAIADGPCTGNFNAWHAGSNFKSVTT